MVGVGYYWALKQYNSLYLLVFLEIIPRRINFLIGYEQMFILSTSFCFMSIKDKNIDINY
jgi:hypothetical protein